MAGRVAAGEKDGFVLSLGLGRSGLSPGEPVHRIVRMLEQVGRLLCGEGIGVLGGSGGFTHGGEVNVPVSAGVARSVMLLEFLLLSDRIPASLLPNV